MSVEKLGAESQKEKPQMHPVMEVETTIDEETGRPVYHLKMSRANFDYLCAGCFDVPALIGTAKNGTGFYIFPNGFGRIPEKFVDTPALGGYSINLSPEIKPEEDPFDSAITDRFEETIKNIGRLPMTFRISERLGNGISGYVEIELEE